MSHHKESRFTPLLLALCLIVGLLIGAFNSNFFSKNELSIINTGSNKLNYLLQVVDNNYVDTVNINNLIEEAMPQILSELDPHSSYISAKDAAESIEDLKGSFSGIGISFTIQSDTVNIMSVIKGGPSEKVGLMAGDRIISVNDTAFVGKIVTNSEAMRRLKGPKDTKVKLGIKRLGEPEPLYFTIVRGNIPVHSVDVSYMLTPTVGYIKIKNFAEKTYPEMLIALAKLNMEGMQELIIDLRGNRGGLMHAPIQMANEFLADNDLILYTEGRKSPREEYRSDGHGAFPTIPLAVLVDEGSASSSEIFAGAIQDNDRGTIIGRRSFGKGLVQQPIEFRDGSIVRLTIARYYTPSGRCIQKPYQKGHTAEYESDLLTRYERGEFFSQDSIKQDGKAYTTRLGRTVYGGGGITPDIFVPEDTTGVTSYFKEAVLSGLLQQFAFAYTDSNRKKLEAFENVADLTKYLKRQNLLNKFASFAEKRGLRRRNLMLYESRHLFERNLISTIIYNAKDMLEYMQYLNESDPAVQRAITLFKDKASFPKAPETAATAGE